MRTVYFYITIILMMIFSCKSTIYAEADIKSLENLIDDKNYSIASNWAHPQVTNAMQQVLNSGLLQPGDTANAINLIGNSNFLTIKNDSIYAYLPYFGERIMNIDYGGENSAIKLNGIIEDYTLKKSKKNKYLIELNARNKAENFNIHITLFPNLKSEIQIFSPYRFPISYSGTVEALNN